MEDDKIIALYWARKEEAISETDRKYGSYCRSISFRILNDKEDSEECVNDTWLHTINRFLETLDAESRKIFVRRYFWAEPVKELAGNLNISEGKVKSQLFRMRAKLKMHLEKEGIAL